MRHIDILLKRGRESKRTSFTPSRGEPIIGFNDATGKAKIYVGDSITEGGQDIVSNVIDNIKNQPNGIAELNSNGKLSLDTTEIGVFGHHIYSLTAGGNFKTVYAGTPVTDDGSNGTVYMPSIGAKETRVVTHGNPADSPEASGDFTYEWLGTSYNYNAVPIQGYILQGMYYKTGSVAATTSVRVRFFKGIDETGAKIFDKIFSASDFSSNSEVHIIFPDLDYAEGQEFHGLLSSDANFSLITNEGNASPWRAVDRQLEEHIALLRADLVFPSIEQVSPVADATGVGLQPTMTAQKGSYVATKTLDYDVAKTQVQIKRSSDQIIVSDRTLDGDVNIPTLATLSGATPYHWHVRHLVVKSGKNIPLPWSDWRAFKTVFNMTVNINTSTVRNSQTLTLASGDLIELNVGESVNASGFNFHVSGEAVAFPSVAYDSGGFRFKDILGNNLNFMIYSVSGTTPNRTAKCFIEVTSQVISDKKIVLTEEVS